MRSDLPPLARHLPAVLAAGLALLVLAMTISIGLGTVWLPPADVWAALAGAPAEPSHAHIVIGLRLPRTIIAALAGALLALAGASLQSATRNDLADPSLIGVTSGGALAIVTTLYLTGRDHLTGPLAILLAFAGGLAISALIWALAWRYSHASRHLVLSGVLISSIASALVSVLLILDGALFASVLRWVVGSLSARTWHDVTTIAPAALLAIPLALALRPALSALYLGEDIAAATGVRTTRARAATLALATFLTASAVSVVGAIGFVGLIGPHLARRLVGEHPARVLPLAGVLGALLLVGADTLAQALSLAFPTTDIAGRTALPAGALTAIIGGPLLFALLIRNTR